MPVADFIDVDTRFGDPGSLTHWALPRFCELVFTKNEVAVPALRRDDMSPVGRAPERAKKMAQVLLDFFWMHSKLSTQLHDSRRMAREMRKEVFPKHFRLRYATAFTW